MLDTTTNLDCATNDELHATHDDMAAHPLMREYAHRILIARSHRLAGRIAEAVKHEREADIAYLALPKHLRW